MTHEMPTARNFAFSPKKPGGEPAQLGGGQWVDCPGHDGAYGGVCRCGDSPGLSGTEHDSRTWLSLDQESRGDRPRVAGEARTDCRVSDADGAGLAGLQCDPETGPSLPAHA